MFKAHWQKYTLQFQRPSGTSRGILTSKDSYFIFLEDTHNIGNIAIGECGLLRGLSHDDRPDYKDKIAEVCQKINNLTALTDVESLLINLVDWPSIRFGVEMAFQDLSMGAKRLFYENDFILGKPIPINGLIWMGQPEFMRQQIITKLADGFTCLKLKIGAIDFETELELLGSIRREFSGDEVEIRVDANGAFSPHNALEKLHRLAEYDLHSIEQPIKQGQWQEMAFLCEKTPLPIALDEELIGINHLKNKQYLLEVIKPQYLIFKPSLIGGFSATQEWINLAEKMNISWWITSALESNIGLNAIAQFTAEINNKMPQGLGTGELYSNNIPSPLKVKAGQLHYFSELSWDLSTLRISKGQSSRGNGQR
jgi:o-succinylbenzoate synthase